MYKIKLNKSTFENNETPIFRSNENAVIDIQLQNADGTPYDITGKIFVMVLDYDFNAKNTPLAQSGGAVVLNAETSLIRFTVPCYGDKIQQLTAIRRNRAIIEINELTEDNPAGHVIFQSTPLDCLRPRLYNPGAESPQGGGSVPLPQIPPATVDLSDYTTKAEFQNVAERLESVESDYTTKAELNEVAEEIVHEVTQFTESVTTQLENDYATKAELAGAVVPFTVPACSNIAVVNSPGTGDNGAIAINWTDPPNLAVEGVTLADWGKTVLIRKQGGYPATCTDGEIVAETSRTAKTKNFYRDNIFHDVNVGENPHYKLFSSSTAGIWNNFEVNKIPQSDNINWQMIRAFVRAGKGAEMFPVGTVFSVDFHESIPNQVNKIYFRVVGYDQMQPADETLEHAMVLDMVDGFVNIQADAPELDYALTWDTVALEIRIYYVKSGSTYTKLTPGVDYQIGQAVPPNSWYEYNTTGTGRGQGCGNWKYSNLRQWANSSKPRNEWYTPLHVFDQIGSVKQNSFLGQIDSDFLSVVQPAKVVTSQSIIINFDTNETSHDLFFPLSVKQVFGNGNDIYDEQLDYYKNGGSKIKCKIGTTIPVDWWLRSYNGKLQFFNVGKDEKQYGTLVQQSLYASLACIIA